MPRRCGIQIQRVFRVRRRVGQIGELAQLVDQPIDVAKAIEGAAGPRTAEVAPLRQVPCGAADPVDRRVLARHVAEALPDGSPQSPADPLGWILELQLDPRAKRLVEQPLRLRLGQDLEERVDARLDRPLPQQLRAEPVDRADVCLLQRLQGLVEHLPFARRRARARHVQRLAEPQLQLAGGLLRKRHRHDAAHLSPAGRQDADDAVDELGGFSRAGSGLDHERLVEIVCDGVPRRTVG